MNPVDRILDLINNKKITERKFLLDLNFGLGTLSEWKSEKSKSYKMHADKIADYFNVSTDYLLCRTDDPTPPSTVKDLKYSDLDMSFYEGVDMLTEEEKKIIVSHMNFLISEREKKEQDKDK